MISLILLLVSNSLTLRRDKSILYSRAVIINFVYCFLLGVMGYSVLFLNTGIGLYGGLFYISSISQIFHLFIYLLTIIILTLTGFYPRKVIYTDLLSLKGLILYKINYNTTIILNKMSGMYKIIEYPLIILFIVNGALFLISASDLVSIFISIELQSYGLYLLSTVYKDSELSTSGGLMYFLLGGLSSCFILLGTSLLYANSGTTNLDNIYVINNISSLIDVPNANTVLDYSLFSIYDSYYIIISLVIMVVGFLFKVSAAPFHFWSPVIW